jgi:acetylornithine deacetylase/succinyl-diaminopimelate desuccinylase-like protein
VPPGTDAHSAQDALIVHLNEVAPWHVQVEVQREYAGQPFTSSVDGRAFRAMAAAMGDAYGRELTLQGDGGSIPLCNVLQETFPKAEIMLLGVEEPKCLIHAPNESVDPTEIENMAIAEARFLECYGETSTGC